MALSETLIFETPAIHPSCHQSCGSIGFGTEVREVIVHFRPGAYRGCCPRGSRSWPGDAEGYSSLIEH